MHIDVYNMQSTPAKNWQEQHSLGMASHNIASIYTGCCIEQQQLVCKTVIQCSVTYKW